MGALTENRKRCFVDVFFPHPPPSSSSQEVFQDSFVTKKLKVSCSQPASDSKEKQEKKDKIRVSDLLEQPQLPPVAPFRRKVQGPQRNIRVFGLGNTGARPEKGSDVTMGGLVSRVAENIRHCSILRSGKGKSSKEGGEDGNLYDGNSEGLELEDYKRLVQDSHEGKAVGLDGSAGERASKVFVIPKTPPGAVSDFRILAGKDEEKQNLHIVNRKVEYVRMVEVELTPGSEDVRWTKRTPVYKVLLQENRKKYDSKLSSLDFAVKLTEAKISGIRISQKEKPKEDLQEPFLPLTDEDENDVRLALGRPNKSLRLNDVLVMHEPSNIGITREIIQCLHHGAWLNDEVINLYLALLKEREQREPKKFLKCHFFNTFFYKKLTSGRGGYDFKAVRRWTTQRKLGYSLIECDKIFVPIHKEIHWCLAVINVKDEKFQYLDSLGGMDDDVLTIVATYLRDEVMEKSNKVIEVASWNREFVHGLPLQKNGWDCGMFMLKYIDFYSRGLSLGFSQDNMSYFRRRTVKEILRLRAE